MCWPVVKYSDYADVDLWWRNYYEHLSLLVSNTHTHTQPFNGLLSGTTRVGRYQKKHSPTHTHPDHRTSFIIFSIYNDPLHPLCSVYELDSPLGQPLSRSSLVFLLVLDPQLHTPYISSPNHHHLFAAHAHTNAACFAAIPMLCHLSIKIDGKPSFQRFATESHWGRSVQTPGDEIKILVPQLSGSYTVKWWKHCQLTNVYTVSATGAMLVVMLYSRQEALDKTGLQTRLDKTVASRWCRRC